MANNETSIIISAVDKTQGALNSVNSNLSSLEGQFSKLTGVVSGFAALAGVTAFAGIIKGAVDSAAGLHDMAQQTGASVESLSAMRSAAKLAGVDMEQVAGGLGKLSKNMLAASQGSGDAAKVFSALGISVTDTNGKMKSSDAVFMEFSKSLQNIGSNSERAAAAQLVLGKSGASLLPMMNDLAVSGELQAKITAKQAAAADDLQDNMTRLATVGQAWKTTVAMEMVPAANAFVEALLEVSTTTDMSKKAAKDLAADGSIKEWAINSAKAVGFVVDAFDGAARVVKGIGMTIGAAAAAAAMLAKGNIAGAGGVWDEWKNDATSLATKEQFSDILARKLANIGTEAPKAAEGTRSLATALTKLSAEGGKASNVLENLHITQMALVTKQAAAEVDEIDKKYGEFLKTVDSLVSPLERQAESLRQQVEFYGMTDSAIQAVIVSRLEEQRAIEASTSGNEKQIYALTREIEARKAIGSASSQKEFLDTNKKAAEQSAKEWEKFSDDINRAITDALMRGFEDGKSFGQNFVDSLKNSLKTAALKVVVNVATSTGGSLANAAINAVAGTSSANDGAGANYFGLANNANSVYSLYGAGTQFFTGASTGSSSAGLMYANGAQMVGGDGIGALYTANGGWAGVDAGAGAAAGSSTASSAWATMLEGGWVALIPIIGKALFGSTERYLDTSIQGTLGSDGFAGKFGDTYKTTGNIFGEVGRQTDWYPVTDSSADIAGSTAFTNKSVVQGLMSPTEYGGYSPEVQTMLDESLSSQLASITEQSAAFKAAFEGIYAVSKTNLEGLAKVFEDSTLTDKIKDYAVNVDLQFSGSVDKVFADFGEKVMVGMGGAWLPSVEALRASGETWSQALGRLVNESAAMGQILLAMGTSIKDAFGANQTDAILKSSDALVKLFGSVEKLGESFGAYYQNFYTQEELNKKAMESLTAQFKDIGLVIPSTRAEFRKMVDSLDLTSNSGQATFKSLMDLQDGFAKLVPAMTYVAAATAEIIDAAGRKSWGDKLAVLTGQKTQIQVDRDNTLESTSDAAVQAIMRLVFAQDDLATAAELTAAAVSAAADETKQIAEAMRVATISSFDRTRASNDAYKSSIQAFSTSGLAAITEAVSLEKQRIGVIRSVAAESVTSIKGVFSLLENQVSDLYGTVASTQAMQASEGSAFIASALQNALSSGYLPDQSALSSAISGARSGLDANNFATQFEADRAALVMAGQLSQLRAVAGQQLPAAEQAVKLADEQLKALDTSLTYYKKQLDSLNGIKEGTADLAGTVEEIGQSVIAKITAMNANFSSLSDALLNNIVTASKSGSISASDTTAELGKSGVAADKAALVGGSAVFTSSNGATLIDGVFRGTNGYTGSITDAKAIITEAFNGLSAKEFQSRAIGIGLSAAMIDYMYSFDAGWTNSWAAQNGLPAFASGTNYVQRDMIAQIHEGEAIIPKAYNPALGNNNSRLEKLVEGLTAEVQRLQSIVDTGNKHASRTANAVNGNPEQPMLVETV